MSKTMIQMRYVGEEKRLFGKTALVVGSKQSGWLAQFDDLELPESHNWHPFDGDCFQPTYFNFEWYDNSNGDEDLINEFA